MRRQLVKAQMTATGLPLVPVVLPNPLHDEVYEQRMRVGLCEAKGERFVGRRYDEALLAELPAGVDPCGEKGEFHTFCDRFPDFRTEIAVSVGEIVERDGFWFADLRQPDA